MTGRKSVLVVEDDRYARDSVCDALVDHGFNAVGVAHGDRALSYLRTGPPPCVILLDLVLPGRDGRAVLEDLRREHAQVPVIVVSALRRTRLPGAVAFLEKPVSHAELLRTVRAYCA